MKIGLLGHGVVGSGVTKIVDGGTTQELKNLEVTKILVKDAGEMTDPRTTTHADEILNDPEIDAVAECMGGLEPAHTYVKTALEHGKHAVTSNKKMLAAYLDELLPIAKEHGVKLFFEATAGGGIPWMASLRQIRRIDQVNAFRGIFNGTTNYILSGMSQSDKNFQSMLKEAQQLGYAEKDPTDDIDGLDVRSKVMLSAAAAFDLLIPSEEIPTYGIRNVSTEEIEFARNSHRTLKLIGKARRNGNTVQASVMPVFLNNTDYLSQISSNINGIESVSDTLGTAGFIGQGAGSLPTAHAVVQDLISISEGYEEKLNPASSSVDNSSLEGIYYVRTSRQDLFLPYVNQAYGTHACVTKKMKLVDLLSLASKAEDPSLFIAEVEE